MPNPKRLLHKRKLAQALHWTDQSFINIAQIYELFDDGRHEKYTELLDVILNNHLLTKELIKRFWVYAYGKYPEDPDSYRR